MQYATAYITITTVAQLGMCGIYNNTRKYYFTVQDKHIIISVDFRGLRS